METFMTIISGVLFTIGVYLVLSKSLLRIILGTSIFTHGVHLMLLAVSGLKQGSVPLLGEQADAYTDPLPQALILTSIVINLALTALFLVVGYRTYVEIGTDNMDKLRGRDDE